MAAVQLVGSEIHGFRTFQDLDIGNIVKDAGRRWLSNHEIYAIICNYMLFCLYSNPVDLPKSGAILLFDRKRLRNFRKDGHNWKKKKDGKTVNESHESLKVGNEERIHVYYVHGQDNPTFARRCYWLLDKNLERDIVLVHYRELKEEFCDKHVYYAGDKDFLESTGLGDNLTVQNHEWRRHEINPMERDDLPLTNDSNNSTAPKEDEVSSFYQSNQIKRKRQREDVEAQQEGSGSEDKRRRFTFWNVACKAMTMQLVQNLLVPILEPMVRRVVKEEVEISQRKLLDIMKQNCGNEASTSGSRSLQVNFIDNLSPPVFSVAGIEGEDGSNIQVALVDAPIEQPLSYDGEPSSSHLGNVHYPANLSLPWTESPNEPKVLSSGEIGEFDYTQQCAASPDTSSVWDECDLDNLDNMGPRYDQALSFPDQVTSSLICDLDPMTQAFCDEDYLQFSTTARMRWTEIGEFDYTQQCAASPDTSSVWDENGLDNLDNMGPRYDQALSFPDQVTSSLICDLDPMTQAFCDEDYLQFSTTARMRWTKVFCALYWFSIYSSKK